MKVGLQDRPSLIDGQYIDELNDYVLYYNPMGHGGVTLVDQQTQKLLSQCDGERSVADLIKLDGRDPEVVVNEVQTLGTREVVTISRQFSQELRLQTNKSKSIACWLHLTNRCNLACSYCYIHKSPGDMSLVTGKLAIDKIIQSAKNQSVEEVNIKFAGGEPFLRFGLMKDLINYTNQIKDRVKVLFSVLSNGTLITPKMAEFIRYNNIGIAVSLDGLQGVNDSTRFDIKGRGSFSRAIQGIEQLKNVGKNPSIMITVSKSNLFHLRDMTEYLLENGLRFRYSLERNCDTGRPELLDHIPQLIEMFHQCYDYIEEHLPDQDITIIHNFADVVFNRPINRICGAGSNFFAIGHDGSLGTCGLGLANPFGLLDEVEDLVERVKKANPILASNKASTYEICCSCPWRTTCAGGCPLQTMGTYGRMNTASPYCVVYKQIIPRILKIKGLQMIRGSQTTTEGGD